MQPMSLRADDKRDFLSERELSAWIGISQPTLHRMRHNGSGPPYIRLSSRRLAYRRSAVEAWLNAQTRATSA